jgi:hypothetical protein
VVVGNEVVVFGYPSLIALEDLPQIDPDRPLLRKGLASGLNPKQRTIILDGLLDSGNSGGPILAVPVGRMGALPLVGVVREYIPEDNLAYPVHSAYPSGVCGSGFYWTTE